MSACPSCGSGLETPLVCTACGVLLSPDPPPTPFEALGVDVAFALDPRDLKKRLLRFSRYVHPDYFGTAAETVREAAERSSARLNDSYEVLVDDFRRADWIVREQGGPSEADERQMPQVFLMEVLEWNETLEEARAGGPGSPAWAALDKLQAELDEQRASTLARVARSLDPLPDKGSPSLTETRRELNA